MTTRTAPAAQSTLQPKGIRVGLVAVNSTYSIPAGASLSAGDVIQMIRVPANSTVVFVGVKSTYAQSVITVGDGLSDARYVGATSTSAQHAVHTFTNLVTSNALAPYTYSTDDTIDISVSLTSITTIAGAFYMTAIISMDSDPH